MDDLKYGVRDKRGDWKPNGRIEGAPLLELAAQAAEDPGVAARLYLAVECLPHGHRAALLVLCRARASRR